MNWKHARRLMQFGRRRENERALGPLASVRFATDPLAAVRAGSICVVSGKGGTGKSMVTASLATMLSRHGRTLIVDADLGVGNAHILQDVHPEHSFFDVVEEHMEVGDILCKCNDNLDLLAGGSGYASMSGLSNYQMHLIAQGLEKLELQYKHLVVDCAAGISPQTISFAAAADVVMLVTTPDVTAMTDAYALYKVLLQRKPNSTPLLVVNRVINQEEAQSVAERITSVSRKFLGRAPRWVATLPEDRAAFHSVQKRQPVVAARPGSELATALKDFSLTAAEELGRVHPKGLGRTLMRHVAYSPRSTRA